MHPSAFSHYCLKLVHTNLNYCVLGTSAAGIFFQIIILSMHLLPRINVMVDFICMSSVHPQGAHESEKIQNEKFFRTNEIKHDIHPRK